ncbi:unnamed protein product, partial [Leptidea sinapis]
MNIKADAQFLSKGQRLPFINVYIFLILVRRNGKIIKKNFKLIITDAINRIVPFAYGVNIVAIPAGVGAKRLLNSNRYIDVSVRGVSIIYDSDRTAGCSFVFAYTSTYPPRYINISIGQASELITQAEVLTAHATVTESRFIKPKIVEVGHATIV